MSSKALKTLCTIVLAATLTAPTTLSAADFATGHGKRQWEANRITRANLSRPATHHRIASGPVTKLGPVSTFGTLDGPDGTQWPYVGEIAFSEDTYSYTGVDLTIYNSNLEVVGNISTTFTLGENETGVNYVEINPYITKKFFNIDDKYEVMVFIHATTKDYRGHQYNYVYSVAPDQTEPLAVIEGNQIEQVNLATASWDENYQMVFERTGFDGDEYYYYYDVFTKADYSSMRAPKLLHTFRAKSMLVDNGTGVNVPMLMTAYKGAPYYALISYEKPYFDPEVPMNEEPVVQPDNAMIVELYNLAALKAEEVAPVSTTRIPMTLTPDYLYQFPGMGGFSGQNDLSFGLFGDGSEPCFIVTTEKYNPANDNMINDYQVYNVAGEVIKTIATDAENFHMLMPIKGKPDQYCFYNAAGDAYHMIELPSCDEVATIPFVYDDKTLSTSLDRVAVNGTYQYVSALVNGLDGPDGSVIQAMGYFDADGSFSHWDELNLGPDVQMAQVAIVGEWLNPYLFNSDDEVEYMVLVKVPANDPTNPSRLQERFRVVNAAGKTVMDCGPDPEMGAISTIYILNPDTDKASLLLGYYNDAYTLAFNPLPLSMFDAGGDGSADNPYMLSSVGDFRCISKFPSANYKVACDIDFGSTPWGGVDAEFAGTLDGDGHVLSNLALTGSGMFKNLVGGAVVKNIILDSPSIITADYSWNGFIAASANYDGSKAPEITNVHIFNGEATVANDNSFGGIVGFLSTGAKVTASSVNAVIKGNDASIGGIVGEVGASDGYVDGCVFTGEIYDRDGIAGGIVGEGQSVHVTNSRVDAAIEAKVCGGIVGEISAYMQNRGTFTNCIFEGEVMGMADGTKLGGIAGEVEEGENITINNCVMLGRVGLPSGCATDINITAHRIAGFTCGDQQGAIDWDSEWWTDPRWETEDPYEHQDEWPRLPVEPDKGLINNYAIDSLDSFSEVSDDANSADGKSVSTTDLTPAFYEAQGFKFGTDGANPWVADGTSLKLYFETTAQALTVDRSSLALWVDQESEVVFTLFGGNAADVDVTVSDNGVIELTDVTVKANTVVVTVQALRAGASEVVATIGSLKATCTVTTALAGVDTVAPDADLNAPVEYYNLQGVKVAQPSSGIFIRRQGTKASKVLVK